MSRFNRGTVGRVDALLESLDAEQLARYAAEHRRRALEAVLAGEPLDESEARRIGRRASTLGYDHARFCKLVDAAEAATLAAMGAAPLVVGLVACESAARSGALAWSTVEQICALLSSAIRPLLAGVDPTHPAAHGAREMLEVGESLRESAAAHRAELDALAALANEQSVGIAHSIEERRVAARSHLGGIEPMPAPFLEPIELVLDAARHGQSVQDTTDSCTSGIAGDR